MELLELVLRLEGKKTRGAGATGAVGHAPVATVPLLQGAPAKLLRKLLRLLPCQPHF